jgi:hypothetical protein
MDFIALVAARLKATPDEVAAARAAAAATRERLDRLAAETRRSRGAADRPASGLLPFPPFDGPTPAAAPADGASERRYTRTAA